jgi:IS30 family transposase
MSEGYSQLKPEERAMIQMHLSIGTRPGKIAFYLGRARSTITRELARNGWQRPRLVARMPKPVQLSRETIYTALYAMPRGQLRASLLELMRRRHKTKRSQQGKNRSNSGSIPEMTLIDLRPVEVNMRLVPGHWEGDLIIGKGNQSQVGTLVERRTLFVALVKLFSGKADIVAEAFTKRLTPNTGVDVYFAHPAHPGNAASWRTPTDCSGNTCPEAPTCPPFPKPNWTTSHGRSTPESEKSLGWKAPTELFLPEAAFDFVQYWSN